MTSNGGQYNTGELNDELLHDLLAKFRKIEAERMNLIREYLEIFRDLCETPMKVTQ